MRLNRARAAVPLLGFLFVTACGGHSATATLPSGLPTPAPTTSLTASPSASPTPSAVISSPTPTITTTASATPLGPPPCPSPGSARVSAPAPRIGPAVTYDGVSGKLLVFGGISGDGCTIFDDTWTWDGHNWSQLHPAKSPPGRSFGNFVFDAGRHETILFGGGAPNADPFKQDTWSWDGSSWSQLQPASTPGSLDLASSAYDAAMHSVVLFGARLQSMQTWVWNGTTWLSPSSQAGPSTRFQTAMAYDAAHQLVVLSGGYICESGSGCFPDDTWVWDGSQWRQVYPQRNPPGGASLAAYDPVHQVVVLFADDGQTWSWDGSNWTQQHPQVSPRPRAFANMTYDPAIGKVVLFGGKISYLVAGSLFEQVKNELWSWDGGNWKQES